MPQLIPIATVAAKGFMIYQGIKTAINLFNPPKQNTTSAPQQRNTQAKDDLKTAQDTASSDAQALIARRRRAGTQTTFTNPLGVDEQASISRKTLLGE